MTHGLHAKRADALAGAAPGVMAAATPWERNASER